MTSRLSCLLAATLACWMGPPAAGHPQARSWTWANPLPQGHTLAAVIWSGTQFLAVGRRGTVIASPDGEAWTRRDAGVHADLDAVVWTGTQFVAVGDSGVVMTSPDGMRWTRRSSGWKSRLTGVGWDGNRLIAVGGQDTSLLSLILFSPDGIEWTQDRSREFSEPLASVFRCNGRTLLANGFGSLIHVPDSNTWRSWEAGGFSSLAWSGSRYFAVGGEFYDYSTSTDGVHWTRGPQAGRDGATAVAWDGNRAIAVGPRGLIMSSTDGQEWISLSDPERDPDLHGIASNGGRTVAVGEDGIILSSSDGTTWRRRDATLTPATLHAIAWSGGKAVAVGDSCVLLTSRNGLDWMRPDLGPMNPYLSKEFTSVAASETRFVAGGGLGDTAWHLASVDGVAWQSSKDRRPVTRLHWTGRMFLGTDPVTGAILSSTDGLAWEERLRSPGFGVYAFASNGTQVLALGHGAVARSQEGISWTVHATGDSLAINALIWAGRRFVAFSQEAGVLTSDDGLQWVRKQLPWSDITLLGAVWTGQEVVAVGFGSGGGVVATSPDGLEWGNLEYVSGRMLNGVAWTGNNLILVGNGGTILVSSAAVAGVGEAARRPRGIGGPGAQARIRLQRGAAIRRVAESGNRLFGVDGKSLPLPRENPASRAPASGLPGSRPPSP